MHYMQHMGVRVLCYSNGTRESESDVYNKSDALNVDAANAVTAGKAVAVSPKPRNV